MSRLHRSAGISWTRSVPRHGRESRADSTERQRRTIRASAALRGGSMPEPDLILENGVVITLDRSSTIAEALAVRQGRIVSVGPAAALAADAGPATRRIDLAGRSVVPGFF